MQNPLLNFRQSSIISKKPGSLSGKLKMLTGSNYHTVSYFLLKLCTPFLLTSVFKRVFRIFLICLELDLLINLVSVGLVETRSFLFWQITQDLNKMNQILNTVLNTLPIYLP